MKTKIVNVLTLLACNVAFAGNDIPANYAMECWDGTYAYNRLSVQAAGDQLNFNSSGQDLRIYHSLVRLPQNAIWGKLDVSFSIPMKSCKISPADPKVFTCLSNLLTLNIKGVSNLNSKIDQKVGVKNAVVQIRKVDEVAMWGNKTSGYELAIVAQNSLQGSPVLAQRYFYGLGENETDHCKMK